MNFPTNERYGYAVLNFLGDEDKIERMPANKKIVFHRVTRNKRTYCNGTDVMNYELRATCPIDRLPPCKRCYHY